ncbi:MAG: type II toxin-antitoxin system HicB family antitoxin [Rhizobiales bacterium]|nr:type II toxin-antitoxin system HicB family antitoxin [Hyphomicrobiales bacterium]
MDPKEILKRPYARLVVPEEDGSFRAEIPEFPGCLATGETRSEALDDLEEVAAAWLAAALKNNQSIPEPVENSDFSGKLVLRMPRSLHKKATYVAEREGVSLNALIVTAVATYLGGPQNRQAPAAPHQVAIIAVGPTIQTGGTHHQSFQFPAGGVPSWARRTG